MLTQRLRALPHAVPTAAWLDRRLCGSLGDLAGEPAAAARCNTLSLFDTIEKSQELCALSHRTAVAEQLVEEVRRRRARFALPKAQPAAPSPSPVPSSSSFQEIRDRASGVEPHLLLRTLQRSPLEAPVTADVAEVLVLALEKQLQKLPSSVIDLRLAKAASADDDPRLIVVGDTHGQLCDVLHILEKQGPPSESVIYLFNGDIVDRGRHAVEIWLLIAAFKLKYPDSVHVLRGNHENEQMIVRPLKMGGGFAEECLGKYSQPLLQAFQRVFKLLPLFAVVEDEVFVVHGGLFRNRDVTLARLRALPEASWRRNYPNPLTNEQIARGDRWTEDEEILFDAQWADPHYGSGSRPSSRGRVAVTFGEDVTHRFLDEAGLMLCLRSHRVPQSGRGFELEHGGRLMTLFSASRYGGVLQNQGAVAVVRLADRASGPSFVVPGAQAPTSVAEEHGGSSSSTSVAGGEGSPRRGRVRERAQPPPLQRLRFTMVEHDVDPKPLGLAHLSAATAFQVRRLVEQQALEYEANAERQAVGLVCAERERLWKRCRGRDAGARGLVPRALLHELLGEICGEPSFGGWDGVLQRTAPDLGEEVAYGEFLATPRVRWFHQGAAQVVSLARATAQAELQLCGLAALFESAYDGVVTPELAREALRRLLPSLRDFQRRELASALFGDAPTELSSVLHQLALFAEPPRLSEPWMKPALRRLAALVEKYHGPPPMHLALMRFFRLNDRDRSDLLTPDEFVRGFESIGVRAASGDGEVPLLDTGRLYRLFSVIDDNHTGTISFIELLLALDERVGRPPLPEFPALEGEVPAMLLLHKDVLLRLCKALDPNEEGRVSVENFAELVAALAEVVGRPLTRAARVCLMEELQRGEDLAYADALGSCSFEVSAEGGPWCLGAATKAAPQARL